MKIEVLTKEEKIMLFKLLLNDLNLTSITKMGNKYSYCYNGVKKHFKNAEKVVIENKIYYFDV